MKIFIVEGKYCEEFYKATPANALAILKTRLEEQYYNAEYQDDNDEIVLAKAMEILEKQDGDAAITFLLDRGEEGYEYEDFRIEELNE